MNGHTFITWKPCGFGYKIIGKNFWQVLLGIVIISRMPEDSKAVQNYRASLK